MGQSSIGDRWRRHNKRGLQDPRVTVDANAERYTKMQENRGIKSPEGFVMAGVYFSRGRHRAGHILLGLLRDLLRPPAGWATLKRSIWAEQIFLGSRCSSYALPLGYALLVRNHQET